MSCSFAFINNNHTMDIRYNIKNFRVFDRNGTDFEMKPITILTGCNSSGKSSVVKSILTLVKYLSNFKDAKGINIESMKEHPMKFNLGQLNLGRYDTVLNKNAAKNEHIVFGYEIESQLAAEKFYVEYTFSAKEGDDLNYGWLKCVSITGDNGEKILDSKEDLLNLMPLKRYFIKRAIYEKSQNLKYNLRDLRKGREYNLPYKGDYSTDILNAEKQYSDFENMYSDQLSEHDRYCFQTIDFNNKFSMNQKSIDSVLMTVSVYAMPALEALCLATKSNIHTEFDKIIPEKYRQDDKIRKVINIISEDFGKSDFDTFGAYFKNMEEDKSRKYKIGETRFYGNGRNNINAATIQGMLMDGICSNCKIDDVTASFDHLAHVLFMLSLNNTEFSDSLITQISLFDGSVDVLPSVAEFSKYVVSVLKEVMIPSFISSVYYVGASRAEIKRLYSVDDSGKDAFGDILVKYMSLRHKENRDLRYDIGINFKKPEERVVKPGDFMNKWLRKFKIAHSISFKNTAEGIGVMAYLHSDENDEAGHLLADEGYGITQLISILLSVETCITESRQGKFVECRDNQYKKYLDFIHKDYPEQSDIPCSLPLEGTVVIEEPETHLHPRYQSLLADMFMDAYTTWNIHFVIETHSEYLIRKFQTFVAKYDKNFSSIVINGSHDLEYYRKMYLLEDKFQNSLNRDEISIYYLYDNEERPIDEPQVQKMELKEDGRLTTPFGPGFFDVADNLAMELLTLKTRK